jgi:hypothetical protein
MIWEYGSLQFLLKIAKFTDELTVREIVRAVLAMTSGLYLGNIIVFLPLRYYLTIFFTQSGNRFNQNESTVSFDTLISPVDREQNIPFPSQGNDLNIRIYYPI